MAYTTLAEVRALPLLANDTTTYSDAMLNEGIAWATEVIDEVTGTAWEPKTKTVTCYGSGTNTIYVGVPQLRSITAATVDGTAEDVSAWYVTNDGLVVRDTGIFPERDHQNVTLTLQHGADAPPTSISWAAKTLARWFVLNLTSDVPSNALSMSTEYGTVSLAQPGARHRPTALPEVNAVLNRYSYRFPSIA